MTVAELITRIQAAYPGATSEAMASFLPVFYARLRGREGDGLAEAATEVLGTFKPTTRQPFPIPLDFEKHLPSPLAKLPGGERAHDFKAHDRRYRSMLADWRVNQRDRASNGIEEVRHALEFVAGSAAYVAAWEDNPPPLRLTRKQVRLAQQQAISQQRRREFGPLGGIGSPKTNEDWWPQIASIAARWGIEAIPEDWGRRTIPGAEELADGLEKEARQG